MKLCIRAHDLGVTGMPGILRQLDRYGIDGVQLVCYKAFEDVPQKPGAISLRRAEEIGKAFSDAGKCVSLVGAYFNPIHENKQKVQDGLDIFSDYLRVCKALGCDTVGSETGSCNNDEWTYHPGNRTEESLQGVVRAFSWLCEVADSCGSTVAMEGCAGHVCYDVDTLARARKMIGQKTKVIFDLYNFMDADNQGDYLTILDKGLETFAGDIQVFHMKDCFLANGQKPIQTPFGKGGLDLHAILRRIKAYDPNAALVLEETTGDDIEHAVNTIKTIWESV
jgi:sugar phosphate isomerase/epimerase